MLHAARSGEQRRSKKSRGRARCALIAGFGANTAIEMSLSELPAALLNVVVQAAGEEHGWRLEVASPALRATSMECCAIRLGRCRWSYGDRAEFRPSWRHVAVALRRCPYYLLRPGGDGPTHISFGGNSPAGVMAMSMSRRGADKFTIEPTMNGEGIIERIYPSVYPDSLVTHFGGRITIRYLHIEQAHWLLHLGSHASHLPFRRCRTFTCLLYTSPSPRD